MQAFVFEVSGINILDCKECGHRFAETGDEEDHIERVYGDHYFTEGGAGYADYLSEERLLRKRGVFYARKLARHTEPGRILDVGCAAGFTLKGFHDAGWNGTGIEPNEMIGSYGRVQLGLDIRHGTLEAFGESDRFSAIAMIQVVAHFREPMRAFEKARDLLTDRGLLLIETWDRGSIVARTLGKHWHEYSPPSVLQWFSSEGLDRCLSPLGFEKLSGGRTLKWIAGDHIKSLLRYRLGRMPGLGLIPDRIRLPYISDDLFYAIYRKR
ncbi:MAG: class I SAM-dependent methyltransferase [Acidobacteria bacterium]|nr:class I SAM-dependent methyltransferase [Acidobacteriota bacterium]